jgi:hypothetical protein
MRTRRSPVFVLVGAVLIVVGLTLMAGTGQALVVFLGIAVAAFSLGRASATMTIVVNRPCPQAHSGRVKMTRPDMPCSPEGG